MGHNSWRARVKRIERAQRDETDRDLRADAVAVVDKWNRDLARRGEAQYGHAELLRLPQFSPHIGAAIRAGKPWLRVLCPGCKQYGDVDLRKVVRPADFPIGGIYDALHCTRCRGETAPEIVGLFATPDDVLGERRSISPKRA